MKRNALAIIISVVIIASSISVYAETPYLDSLWDSYRTYKDNTYDVYCDEGVSAYTVSANGTWQIFKGESKDETILRFSLGNRYSEYKVKVPDSITDKKHGKLYIKAIDRSCSFKEFDLNPENKYMKLVDNVVFSKDGKILMSYAQEDERTVYEIPNGTKVISEFAFLYCNNIEELIIPDSVTEIEHDAFFNMRSLKKVNIPPLVEELDNTFCACDNLSEVYIPPNSNLKKIVHTVFKDAEFCELTLPSFEIEISNIAFGYNAENVKLKSYVKPIVKTNYSVGEYILRWDEIPNASKYEIYQKKSDGSYKLLKETQDLSLKINGIKAGKTYTFSVKPIAEIKATPYEPRHVGFDEKRLPEYYIIEGTMSDDVTIVG
ncbi:MAG: leucine-rich repeat domain-containing protein [Ruminococcus sp.]|nr:leucine-rich repeat domain-containing protein [Ruminococcus sp.]